MAPTCDEVGCEEDAVWEVTLPGLRSERQRTVTLCEPHAEEWRRDDNVYSATRLDDSGPV